MVSPDYFTSIINSFLPEPNASLVNGMLFGEDVSKQLVFYENIKRSGLLHLVVLSGSNISILGAMTGSILSFLPKKLAIIANLCLIAGFVCFVGVEAPILRAAIMAACMSLAIFFERKTLSIYALFVSALIMSMITPQLVASVSFQLSFAATLGIILFSTNSPSQPIFIKEIKPSLAAFAFTSPIIWFYFQEISFVSPISNVLVGWIIAPIMLVGFITLFLALLFPVMATPLFYLLEALTDYLVLIINETARIPFGYAQW